MQSMISLTGEPEQLAYLPEIASLGAGVELGSYGLVGVRSEHNWEARLAQHRVFRAQFHGALALHGPFIGMEFDHIDHLIRAAVHRRLDLTFEAAVQLRASRVVLHSGYKPENDLFSLQEAWLQGNIKFWQGEISRWAEAGIDIVLENDIETTPDLLVRLVNAVDHPGLSLCLDVGHQHVFSELGALEWVRRMGQRLVHFHLHDNDGSADRHWRLGRGNIDFDSTFALIQELAPHATLSLEVEEPMEVKMGDLRRLAARFTASS